MIPIRHNGVAYRGVNILLLWIEAMRKGFGSPKWMTYNQAQTWAARFAKANAEHGRVRQTPRSDANR